ncbi:DUF3284 domain-containing protein [Paraclostridium sordellii]|uniref:DUF3284 domain-containing protein n=1 Tax=Paraclostridium sordellii TaxID=1505 RepID=A0A0C7QKA5_PARSO|nr:DUF3284 domain-containing protein [Paeniclostridium sordellii]CEN78875.1 hypothetical protein DUF3284 [[Clostridium] sordellii] [Paeniclostridium sordellii]CEQ03971.1 hypothetical protein DUF3284 [[Clostridium] sordellii] [Paeniclostridium sordellii]
MIKYENKKIINANPDKIFNVFLDNAKDTFKKINLTNPIGCKTTKNVKRDSKSENISTSYLEITDFKKDKVYEITFTTEGQTFISRYMLNKLDNNQTELTSVEKFINNNNPNKILDSITKFFYSSKVKKRFNHIVNNIESNI